MNDNSADFTQLAFPSLIVCGLMILSPAKTNANDMAAPTKIRWSQIVDAIDSHPILKKQALQNRKSQAAIKTAQSVPNPTVEVSLARGKGKETDDTALEWGAALTIPLDWLATRTKDAQAASAAAAVNESDRILLRQEVIANLRRLFWRCVYQGEKEQRLQQLQAQANALTQLVKKRVENGDVPPTELTRVQIEAEKVTLALTDAQLEKDALQTEIAQWIDADRPIFCDASLSPPKTEPPQATPSRLLAHASLKRLHRTVSAADARIVSEKRRRFPEMALTVFAESELDKTALGAGVALSVPLWNFNNGPIQQEMAAKAIHMAEIEVQTRQLERRRLRTNASCRSSFHLAKEFESRVLQKVTAVAAKMERAYRLGEATLLDVLDARRSVLSAQSELLDAQLKARLDCGEVYALTGEEEK